MGHDLSFIISIVLSGIKQDIGRILYLDGSLMNVTNASNGSIEGHRTDRLNLGTRAGEDLEVALSSAGICWCSKDLYHNSVSV